MASVLDVFVLEAPSGSHYFPYEVFIHRQEGVHPGLVPVRAAVPPAYDANLIRLEDSLVEGFFWLRALCSAS